MNETQASIVIGMLSQHKITSMALDMGMAVADKRTFITINTSRPQLLDIVKDRGITCSAKYLYPDGSTLTAQFDEDTENYKYSEGVLTE